MDSSTPKVRGRWLRFTARDHRGSRRSCNATCHHEQTFSYVLRFLPLSPTFFLASPPFFHSWSPFFFLTTSKLPLGLYCILQSENVMNAFDMCEGILKHTDILKPLQRDVWRRIQLACVCSKICKSCCVEGEGCHYCRQIQGWEVSVGWLEVSRDCKQLNKRRAKVMLHFVSVGVGPLR